MHSENWGVFIVGPSAMQSGGILWYPKLLKQVHIGETSTNDFVLGSEIAAQKYAAR